MGLCRRPVLDGTRKGKATGDDAHESADRRNASRGLATNATLAGIDISPRTAIAAANVACALSAAILVVPAVLAVLRYGIATALPVIILLSFVPLVAREIILSYPKNRANRRADEVMRSSAEATNLMIMSLRHEPSLSRAIRFASRRDSAFSLELRKCEWGVLTGRFSSFEEALLDLGDKWGRFSEEIKSSLNSMVTSTCESTQDGRRRALDRANQAMVSGAKRRVEDYVLSLSTPSMVIFGLCVLLPLMVGSFLPMLSWDLWSIDGMEGARIGENGRDATLETVFLMNVLFPAIGLLATISAVSRNPMAQRTGKPWTGTIRPCVVAVVMVLSACVGIVSYFVIDGFAGSVAVLLACLCPCAFWLAMTRETDAQSSGVRSSTEDALFKIGARMVEGQNFESAFRDSAKDLDERLAHDIRLVSFDIMDLGDALDGGVGVSEPSGSSNSLDGLRVVSRAAAKDERAAGILAMDLAAYLKDLRDIESTLKSRLKPTISMMRMTSYVLGPVVLGVAYGIYLSLASIADNGSWTLDPRVFFLVLGFFLAESNAVVTYFVWAVDSDRSISRLIHSLGWCIVVASVVYSLTAALAS